MTSLSWWDIWGRFLVRCCQRYDYLGECAEGFGSVDAPAYPWPREPGTCRLRTEPRCLVERIEADGGLGEASR